MQVYGAPSGFRKTMDLIYREWMPGSGYALDAREHFELLGEKYRHDSPDSEEEVWVPVIVSSCGDSNIRS